MKKTLVAGIVVALVAGCLLAPATAAKKKKPKKPKPPVVVEPVQTDVTYFLRRSDCTGDAAETTLSIVDGPDEEGDECGALESGIATEAMLTAGQDPPAVGTPAGDVDAGPDRVVWTAEDGVPFVLDATKEIAGTIHTTSFCCDAEQAQAGVSAGSAKLNVLLTGTVDGAAKPIGETTVEFTLTPATYTYAIDFKIKADAALDKASFTSLELTLTNRGVSYLNGFYSVDDPASSFTIGTWK